MLSLLLTILLIISVSKIQIPNCSFMALYILTHYLSDRSEGAARAEKQ